jgi:hypothetical protein
MIPQGVEEEEEEEEEDHSIPEDALTETCNKGGGAIGSTIENCQIQAVIIFVIKYAMRLEENWEEMQAKIGVWHRENLVKRAIKMFIIKSKFDIPKQIIRK